MNKHIILVGFMCSGKNTYGKLLASAMGVPFVDIDDYITAKYNKTVAGIFAEHGEDYFRQLEHEVIKELLQSSPAVIASGGGTPCFNNNMDLMNQSAITVYLQSNPKTIFSWLKDAKHERPLLKGKTDDELLHYIENLLEQRKQYYEQAQITVSALHFDAKKLITIINEI